MYRPCEGFGAQRQGTPSTAFTTPRAGVLVPQFRTGMTYRMNMGNGAALSRRNPPLAGENWEIWLCPSNARSSEMGSETVSCSYLRTTQLRKPRFGRDPQSHGSCLTLLYGSGTLEVEADHIIHVIHVSGKCMIAQGTDGLSRGDKSTGVMQRVSMESFVPLHHSTLYRSTTLHPWLTAAAKGLEPVFLKPEGWFTTGQGLGTFVWHPAPAAADVVVEQLGKSRHKRPMSLHIVVIPRIMTGSWRWHMTRECDCYFPAGCTLWGKTQYEPVLIFVCLPFVVHMPDFPAKHRLLEEFRGAMLQEDLWTASDVWGEGFFAQIYSASEVPLPLVTAAGAGAAMCPRTSSIFRGKHQSMMMVLTDDWLGMSFDFYEARNGDSLLTPFQCDLCHFRNILGRGPVPSSFKDSKILAFIRRANFDSTRQREPNTVSANLREAIRMECITDQLDLPSVTPAMGLFPLRNDFEMLAAIAVLDRSLAKGIHSEYVQGGTF
jgi:hypothetical protein